LCSIVTFLRTKVEEDGRRSRTHYEILEERIPLRKVDVRSGSEVRGLLEEGRRRAEELADIDRNFL
jgi:hypothetical protein